jgi:hypothetical protein
MFIGKQGALRLAVPAELILARGLMRSLNQQPVLYARAVTGKQQEVRDDKATVVMLPLAIADFRFQILGESLLEVAGLKGKGSQAQHVLWMHAQKAQEWW